jgi:hypothetical protein
MSQLWKSFEKRVADFFNTQRTPFSGSNSNVTSSDSLHDRLYLECKYWTSNATVKLMQETEAKAKQEGKTPILAFGNPEDPKKNIYMVMNVKDILSLLREIDLSYLDKTIPEGTTVSKLLASYNSEGLNLLELKESLVIELKRIMRDKIISNENLDSIKDMGVLIYMIDTLMDYLQDEGEIAE